MESFVFLINVADIGIDIDQAALEKLSAHIKAQEEANRLKISEINILRRREQLSLDEREATVKLRAEVERLVTALRELSEEIAANRMANQLTGQRLAQKIELLNQEVADVEKGLYSALSRDIAEMRKSRDKLGTHIGRREELQTHYHNLEKLQAQAAKFGPLDVPLKIQNQIEELQNKINELEV